MALNMSDSFKKNLVITMIDILNHDELDVISREDIMFSLKFNKQSKKLELVCYVIANNENLHNVTFAQVNDKVLPIINKHANDKSISDRVTPWIYSTYYRDIEEIAAYLTTYGTGKFLRDGKFTIFISQQIKELIY